MDLLDLISVTYTSFHWVNDSFFWPPNSERESSVMWKQSDTQRKLNNTDLQIKLRHTFTCYCLIKTSSSRCPFHTFESLM